MMGVISCPEGLHGVCTGLSLPSILPQKSQTGSRRSWLTCR